MFSFIYPVMSNIRPGNTPSLLFSGVIKDTLDLIFKLKLKHFLLGLSISVANLRFELSFIFPFFPAFVCVSSVFVLRSLE